MQRIQNEDMHVPARFWLDPTAADPEAVQQAMRLCKLPFAVAAAFMPNLSVGMPVPTGTVFATDGYVIPNAVAADLGCGVSASRTTVHARELVATPAQGRSALRSVLEALTHLIPSGHGHHGEHARPQVKNLNEISPLILPIPGLGHPAPTHLVKGKEAVAHALRRAPHQLGTLGGGQHFLELQADEEDRVWIVVHTGSRGLGEAVCRLYDALAAGQNARWFSWLPGIAPLPGSRPERSGDLAFLPPVTGDAQAFGTWAAFCTAFASENRARIIGRVEELLFDRLPGDRTDLVDTPHTFLRVEQHGGRPLTVHRRNAVRTEPGAWACVATSPGEGVRIVEGTSSADALQSGPHAITTKDTAGARSLVRPVFRLRPIGALGAARRS